MEKFNNLLDQFIKAMKSKDVTMEKRAMDQLRNKAL